MNDSCLLSDSVIVILCDGYFILQETQDSRDALIVTSTRRRVTAVPGEILSKTRKILAKVILGRILEISEEVLPKFNAGSELTDPQSI